MLLPSFERKLNLFDDPVIWHERMTLQVGMLPLRPIMPTKFCYPLFQPFSPLRMAQSFFYADGFYGAEPDAAGYMPLEQSEEIIRHCVRLWRAAQIE